MRHPQAATISVRHTEQSFHGGIHPQENKSISNQRPPEAFFGVSGRLLIPVKQNAGVSPKIIVKQDEHLGSGQPLAIPSAPVSSAIHAPGEARILKITEGFCGHPSGMAEPQVELSLQDPINAKDNLLPGEWQPEFIELLENRSKEQLYEAVSAAGIVGLGGATFPTQVKLKAQPIETIIINAMECEPYITCDDVMLRFYARQVLLGAAFAAKIVGANKIVAAIEDNKPEASQSLRDAAIELSLTLPLEIVIAPTKYPSGGEKQLIELVTGQQVAKGKLPASMGLLVQNVGTLFAIFEAIAESKALVRRLVTVTGDLIKQPGNYWIYFGTPVSEILKEMLIDSDSTEQVIIGGPLMGNRISDFSFPVQKNTNCIIANSERMDTQPWLTRLSEHQPCIRCGECEKACPVELLPQQLYWYANTEQWENLQAQDLSDCIECGACAYVCPSEIPLVHYFRYGKSELRALESKKRKSDRAKTRFEFREFRLQREKEERALKHKKAAEARKKEAAKNDQEGKQAAIQAALDRVKAKKSNNENSPSEQP